MRRHIPPALIVAAFLSAIPAAGTVIHVPLEYGTLQEAIDVAAEGDTVLVGPDTYSGAGNFNLDFGGIDIVLRSSAGPDVTIIDCAGFGRGFYFHSGESLASVIDGFTITNGSSARGSGLRCEAGSDVTVLDCSFVENAAGSGGGGVSCAEGSDLVVRGTSFIGNSALRGAGLIASGGGTVLVEDSEFMNNTGSLSAGMRCEGAPAVLNDVVFAGNVALETIGGFGCFDADYQLTNVVFRANAGTVGGGFGGENATATLTNCTFALNGAIQGAAINCGADAQFDVTNSVIAFHMAGDALHCDPASTFSITKSCVSANAAGDSLCGSYHDNIFEDPLFCDVWGGNLRVFAASPCLPDNNPWGELVGAYGGGCEGPSATEPRSWGAIKSLFR
jgi:hypothetical protein